MQSSKEQQGEIRKPSSLINAKKQRKTTEGKARDRFKKIRDTMGTFHAKVGSIKDRNGTPLTEAEDIKKRWQEYTELYKKDLHDQDSHDGMITHQSQTSWNVKSSGPQKASLQTKLVEVMEFQLRYFNSVKDTHKLKLH